MLHKDWSDSSNWEVAKTMHHIITESTKVAIQKAKYIIVSCDEVTNINNQSWCNVHAHIVDGFKGVPLLLNLEMLLGGGTIDNLIVLILMSLMEYGGLTIEHVISKLTCFASDKVAFFTSIQTNVVTQLKYKVKHHL
jgi:hypothetical protein